MGDILHGCARTTEAVRRAIQETRAPGGSCQALRDQSEPVREVITAFQLTQNQIGFYT
jgi:hypothetical protein